MATKNNIRSIRFSDELAELIDRQIGDTFTQKFENLITRCVYELPKKEAEIAELEKKIRAKRQQLAEASSRYAKMLNTLQDLEPKMKDLEFAIGRAITDWPDEDM